MAKRLPDWLRALNIFFGFIGILLSFTVLANPEFTIGTTIIFISIMFMVIGIARILFGVLDENLSTKLQIINIFVGIMCFVLAIFSIVYSRITLSIILYLFSFTLMIIGIIRVATARTLKLPGWFRFILYVAGFLTILFSFLSFVYPDLGVVGIVTYIAVSLLLNSFVRIISGLTGVRQKDITTTGRRRKRK